MFLSARREWAKTSIENDCQNFPVVVLPVLHSVGMRDEAEIAASLHHRRPARYVLVPWH